MAQTIGDSTLLDAWASSGDIVEPDLSKIEQGWLLGEQPPHEFFNWIQNEFGQKINHVLQRGVASHDSAKTYAVGDVVGSGGSVWIAQAINTNSAPGPVNTDWVVVLTADDFATDAETQTGTSDSVAVTPASLSSRTATDSRTGVVELATDTEAQDGLSDSLAVTPANLNATVLGMGQSVTDVTASRALGTNYTNTSGRTLWIIVTSNFNTTAAAMSITVDGVTIEGNRDSTNNSHAVFCTAPIPPGAVYQANCAKGLASWSELT